MASYPNWTIFVKDKQHLNIAAFLTASAINGERATIAIATTVNAQSHVKTQATQTKWHTRTATTAIAAHKETQTTQAKRRSARKHKQQQSTHNVLLLLPILCHHNKGQLFLPTVFNPTVNETRFLNDVRNRHNRVLNSTKAKFLKYKYVAALLRFLQNDGGSFNHVHF
jgi:hypothetical protein